MYLIYEVERRTPLAQLLTAKLFAIRTRKVLAHCKRLRQIYIDFMIHSAPYCGRVQLPEVAIAERAAGAGRIGGGALRAC
jgi:hypothetical protein